MIDIEMLPKVSSFCFATIIIQTKKKANVKKIDSIDYNINMSSTPT